ncbi:unnamed protein product [Cercospora beticola]|nr:unnamed protein product [Cercospora beticola]
MHFTYLTLLLAATAAALPGSQGTSPNVLSLRATPPSDDGVTFKDGSGKTIACYAGCYVNFCDGYGFEDLCCNHCPKCTDLCG